jgi:biotin carboxyl carrier protein
VISPGQWVEQILSRRLGLKQTLAKDDHMRYHLSIGDHKYEVEVGEIAGDSLTVQVNGAPYEVVIDNPEALNPAAPSPQPAAAPPPAAVPPPKPAAPVHTPPPPSAAAGGDGAVQAPIPGRILDIKVQVGEAVQAGQTVATMEAMKMENNIVSNGDVLMVVA